MLLKNTILQHTAEHSQPRSPIYSSSILWNDQREDTAPTRLPNISIYSWKVTTVLPIAIISFRIRRVAVTRRPLTYVPPALS